MNNKIIDLFCGCGGLSKGFEKAGFEVFLAIDSWQDAIETFNFNHVKSVAKCMDIHDLSDDYLFELKKEGINGVIGGPPCQGYSSVGTRDINDPRNHLYLEYCRVVKTLEPDFFVIENVKGLLTLNNGAFKNDIIKRFTALGYNVQYKIVNAADYGVPQNRYRVFFVGLKNGKSFNFPKGNINRVTSKEAISDLISLDISNGDNITCDYLTEPQNQYQIEMRMKQNKVYNHQLTHHSQQTIDIISMIPNGGKIKDLPMEYWGVRKYNKAFERMNSEKPSNTVDTGHRNYFHYSENRIPTVRENCRLQSFSDDFIVLGSRTSQYKQVGNAVPPLLAFEIAKEIKKQL
jgi:DNA (cytosine-5)-methyltransferase 1